MITPWAVARDSLAGYALARLAAQDTVAVKPMAWFLGHITELAPRLDDEPAEVQAAVWQLLRQHEAAGILDRRVMWMEGWAEPKGESRALGYVAEMVTCPHCLSWWTTLAVGLVTGRLRPWRPRDWITQFATWAIAGQLTRAPWNEAAPAFGADAYLAVAREIAAGETFDQQVGPVPGRDGNVDV